jgi:phospho-N-acetylmuramoyl-pentapeptide-transferase
LLYWLLYEKLYLFFHPFRLFRFLTFRTAFASLTALLIALFIGPWVIQKLREFQIGQYVRDDGPQSHLKKTGTPTMGGILIVIAILVPTLLWSDLSNPFVWVAIVSTLAFGAIGFADDYIKVVKRRSLGLTARAKIFYQMLAGAAVAIALAVLEQFRVFSTRLTVPFVKQWRPDLLWHIWPTTIPHMAWFAFLPFVVWIIVMLIGSSNAVNLTDGLDGLAIGCTIIAAGALTVLTYVSGNVVFADYLELQHMPKVAELTVFCGAMVGASIGFLWYNAHPAEIFMGDVGSLAIGGAIGTVAVIIRQELLLQVGSYKLRNGKRIFRMAPLHHHFEQLGWSESKVIVRFWIGALVFAMFALTTLKLR